MEEQIIAILKEHEAGMKTADLCRKHGISDASFYNWKVKYGGLEVSEAKRLKWLAGGNAELRKLLPAPCSKLGAPTTIKPDPTRGSAG
jgi:putative transposase